MLEKLAIGVGLVCLTTIIHASFMVAGVALANRRLARHGPSRYDLAKAVSVSLFTAWLFIGVMVEVLVWALVYLYTPGITALPDLETALYFSMVTFTTIGYGDVVLSGPWRILASIQGANGVIIFGWTTALIFYHIQHVYARH
jgi:hypothetical protein